MFTPDFFPADVRPRRTPLRWSRRRPQGWLATAYHGKYEISPHLRHHHLDGAYRLCWRRGDGFTVRYQRTDHTADTHVPGVTTWHTSVAEAMNAIRLRHEGLVRANTAPRRRCCRRRSPHRRAASAELCDARARLAALLQPALPLSSREDAS